MSTIWLKNFVGIRQSEFEMLKVPRANTEFCLHVTLRSIQTGTILGSLLSPAALLVRRGQYSFGGGDSNSLRRAFVDGGITGAIVGAALGPIITYLSLRNISSVRLYDRCYRLRFDSEQLNLDRSCVVGATIGYLSSGSLGFVVGVDLALLFSSILSRAWK